MKITRHVRKRGGQVYWIAKANTVSETDWLRAEGWNEARFGGGFITYDASTVNRAEILWGSATESTENHEEERGETMNYESMTVKELRPLVREKGWTGADVLNASKAELVKYLETGEKPVKTGEVNMDEIGKQLAELIGKIGGGGGVDAEAVKAIVKEEMGNAVKRIEVNLPEIARNHDCGIQHKDFEKLLRLATVRVKAMIVGPAGSGKTHVCHSIADALGVKFYPFSVGSMTTDSKLLGYMDANGKYVSTPLYHAYKEGGLYLLDEIDAGNANVITCLNALLANGGYTFPNGEYVEQHKDFICFAAANTFGRGADRMYVGRNQLDAASLDRFAVVNFDYDEALETQLAGNKDWTDRVQAYRKAVYSLKELVLISPRASIEGAKLLAVGFKLAEVEEMVVWKGIESGLKQKIKSSANIG